MAESNRDRVGKILDLLRDGLARYVLEQLQAKYKKGWIEKARQSAGGRASLRATLRTALKNDDSFLERADITLLVSLLLDFYNEVFEPQLGQSGRTLIHEIRDIRNEASHQQPFRVEDAHRAADSATRLLEMFSAPEAKEVQKLRRRLAREMYELTVAQDMQRQARLIPEAPSTSGLLSWRDVIEPHPDVAAGRFVEAEFMANLTQVHVGDASSEYQDPKEFFDRTFLTEGLVELLKSAIGRLHGIGGQPVWQLKTGFGGGKTHSMLALFHLFGGQLNLADLPEGERLVEGLKIDALPTATRAVFVGTASAPGSETVIDGTTIRTMWGDLAYQIGGVDAFQSIAEDDASRTSPHLIRIRDILDAHGPVLILVDEYVAFARQLVGRDDLPAGSWEANLSFMHVLTEAVALSQDSLLVVSLPESDMEVGGKAGKTVLDEVSLVVKRGDKEWAAVQPSQGFEIVRRRLFSSQIDHGARDSTVRAFQKTYRQHPNDFPSEVTTGDYLKRMESCYPVHPEVFDQLYETWSTLGRFQQTRGVLRLMAHVIHTLWAEQDSRPLILPGSIPLHSAAVRSELLGYLPQGWSAVIDKDVDGIESRPFQIDRDVPALGRYGSTRRVSRTVFLATAPSAVEQQSRGIGENRIRLGSVLASEPTAPVGDALSRLAEDRTYLYNEGARWWYDTRPTIDRLVREKAQEVAPEEVSAELERRLESLRRERGSFAQVHSVAHGPADVPDERDTRLVVLPLNAPHRRRDSESPGIDLATRILNQRAGGNRTYRNALVFLVADGTSVADLNSAIRLHLAWKSLENDPGLNLDDVQHREIETNIKRTDSSADARILEAYSLILVPQTDAKTGDLSWSASKIPAGNGGIAERASRKLANDDQLIGQWSPRPLHMELERHNLWQGENHLGVQTLWAFLATYPYLPRIQNRGVLEEALAAGVGSEDYWGYADGVEDDGRYLGLKLNDLVVRIVVDEHSVIVTPEAARRQIEADHAASAKPDSGDGDGGPGPVPPEDGGEDDPAPPTIKLTRFHGTVKLDSGRVGRDASQIAQEIIAHLEGLPTANVEVVLEILAEVADGVPDDVVRTVTENSAVLKFDEGAGFEES